MPPPSLQPCEHGSDATSVASVVSATRDAGYHTRMRIYLNGESREIAEGLSVAGLLAATGHAERRIAVEINREIVPRGQHAERVLAADDRVEIVHAIGGG